MVECENAEEERRMRSLGIAGNCQTTRTDDLNPYSAKFWVLLDVESGDMPSTPSENIMGSILIRIYLCRARANTNICHGGRTSALVRYRSWVLGTAWCPTTTLRVAVFSLRDLSFSPRSNVTCWDIPGRRDDVSSHPPKTQRLLRSTSPKASLTNLVVATPAQQAKNPGRTCGN